MSKKKDIPAQKPQEVPAQTQSVAKESEYKGHPVLALHPSAEGKSLVSFGLIKAGLIVAHLDEIKAFHAKHNKQGVNAAA